MGCWAPSGCYSISNSPRFLSPSSVFTAAKRRARSTRLVVRIDIKDEDQVLVFEKAANRRMMSGASPKYSLAAEVHDVASTRIVGAAQMLPKLIFAEIAQEGDFPGRIGPRDIGQLVQRKAHDAHASPTSTRASKHLALSACRLPQRPIRVGNGSGPATRPI